MQSEIYKPQPHQENRPKDSRELTAQNIESWINLAREKLQDIKMPQKLREIVEESLKIPQLGPYHSEGPIMAAHIGLMIQTLEEIKGGSFDFSILKFSPGLEELRNRVISIITTTVKNSFEQLLWFIYLHDIGKLNCMMIIDSQKNQTPFTMNRWQEYLQRTNENSNAALEILKSEGYTQISYRIGNKDHGEEGVRIIQELTQEEEKEEINDFINRNEQLLKIISSHEVHFQIFNQSSSARNFEKHIIEKGIDINLFFTACFLDIAGSLNSEGLSDFTGFINMIIAWECYMIIDEFLQNLQADEVKKQQIKDQLINLGSIEAVRRKIQEIKNEERLKKVKLNEQDIDEIVKEAKVNRIITEEEEGQLTEILQNSIHEENLFAFLGKELPPKWKRLIPLIRAYLLKKLETDN